MSKIGLVFHAISRGVFFIGKFLLLVVTWISYFFLSKNNVLAMGEREHACCFSLGRCREPPYVAVMNLVRPWYIIPSWPRSLRACSNCWPIQWM